MATADPDLDEALHAELGDARRGEARRQPPVSPLWLFLRGVIGGRRECPPAGERSRHSERVSRIREMEKESLLSVVAPVAGVLAVLLTLAEVLIDWITEIRLNISILYGLPLVVVAATRSRRLLWALALFSLITTFAVYCVQIPPAVFSLRESYFVNRVLAAFALVLTAALLHVGMIGLDLLEAQRRSLKEQNEELERRRREAEEASSHKTRFLASVSHDIRTPLQTITLMADILCRAADGPT